MKIFLKILFFFLSGLALIVSIAFGFLNFRSLFAGDQILMNSVTLGFLTYLFRGLFFLLMAVNALLVIIHLALNKKFTLSALIFTAAVALSGVFLFFTYEWYIALISFILCDSLIVYRILIQRKL